MNFLSSLLGYLGVAVVGILGYALVHFVSQPILTLRGTITTIAKALVMYANIDSGVPNTVGGRVDDEAQAARNHYRDLASMLHAQANSIPFYSFWSWLKLVRPFEAVQTARANLMGLSNALGRPGQGLNNSKRELNVREALGIRE